MGTLDKLTSFRNSIIRNFQGKISDKSYSEIVLIIDSFSNIINNHTSGMYDDSIKEISVKLMGLIFIMKFKGKQYDNDVEIEFLKSVYMSTVQEYIDSEFNNSNNIEQTNQLFDIVWGLDMNNIDDVDFDYHRFCQNPNGALNNFIFKVFKDNFQNDELISFRDIDKWNGILYKAIERLLETDKRFMSLYENTSPSPIKKCITSLNQRMKHKAFIIQLMNQNLFNEQDITYDKVYCSLPYEIKLNTPVGKFIFDRTENNLIELLKIRALSYKEIEQGNEVSYLFKCDNENVVLEYMRVSNKGLILVHGNPGQGKSILTTKISSELSRSGELVFRANLSHINFNSISDVKEAIFELLSKQNDYFYHLIKDTTHVYLDKIEEIRNTVFVFDGLDEIKEDYTFEKAQLFLDYIYENLSENFRVIVSMRSNLFKTIKVPSINTTIELCELEKIYQEKVLLKYKDLFEINDVSIEDIEKMDVDFLKTPLLIFLFVWLVHYGVDIKNITSKSQLYELILSVVYEKNYDKQSKFNKAYNYNEFLQILQIIGFCSFLNKMRDIPVHLCREYAVFTGADVLFDEWVGTSSDKSKGINYLITQFFLEKGSESSIYFHHYTFSEYLWCKELITRVITLEDESEFDYLQLIEFPIKIFKYEIIRDKYNGASDYPLFDSVLDELTESNRKKFNDNCFRLYIYCLEGNNKLVEDDKALFINKNHNLKGVFNCKYNQIKKHLHQYNIQYYENIMNLIFYSSDKLVSKQRGVEIHSNQDITALIHCNLFDLSCSCSSAVFYNLNVKEKINLVSKEGHPEFYCFNSFISKRSYISLECTKDIKISTSNFDNGEIYLTAKIIRITSSNFVNTPINIEAEELYMDGVKFKTCQLTLKILKKVSIRKSVFESSKVNEAGINKRVKNYVKRGDLIIKIDFY